MVLFRIVTDEYLSPPTAAQRGAHRLTDRLRGVHSGATHRDELAALRAHRQRTRGSIGPGRSAKLARSIAVGRARFIGALAVLHARNVLDEEAVTTELHSAGAAAAAYERIWSRLRAAQPAG
jgi:hypothetical protein